MADGTEEVFAEPVLPRLSFDPEEFASDAEGLDLTDEACREVLEIIWNIMVAHVDVAFKMGAIQLLRGQFEHCAQLPAAVDADAVELGLNPATQTFERAAATARDEEDS